MNKSAGPSCFIRVVPDIRLPFSCNAKTVTGGYGLSKGPVNWRGEKGGV